MCLKVFQKATHSKFQNRVCSCKENNWRCEQKKYFSLFTCQGRRISKFPFENVVGQIIHWSRPFSEDWTAFVWNRSFYMVLEKAAYIVNWNQRHLIKVSSSGATWRNNSQVLTDAFNTHYLILSHTHNSFSFSGTYAVSTKSTQKL